VRKSLPQPARPGRTSSFSNFPKVTTRSSASAGRCFPAANGSAISIARALLIDPRILILDEATSSVDTETEREIQEALDNLIRGRTTIAIAHRLSTLRKADRLAVLERGRLVELGPEAELLAAGGAYARLHEAQRKLAAEEGVPPSEHVASPAPTPFAMPEPTAARIIVTMTAPQPTTNVELALDEYGSLVAVSADGTEHHNLHAVRCFPLSEPDRWLSLCDEHGARSRASSSRPG
jgi:hypothetical protein